jgi:hypothetical protein
MPLLPGNCCIFGATVFSTARIPPFEIAIGKAGVGLNEIERAAGDVGDGACGVIGSRAQCHTVRWSGQTG